jgi:hypothetical protein
MGLFGAIGGFIKKGVNFLNTGGGTYTTPILSVKGQVDRAQNVFATVKSAFTGGGVQVNRNIIKNEPIAKAIEKVASHPLISAGVVTGGITAYKAIAGKGAIGAATKEMTGTIKNKIQEIKKPKQTGIINEAPSGINTEESVAQQILQKDNPTIAAAAIAAGGVNVTKAKKSSSKARKKKYKHKKVKKHKRSRKKRKLKFGSPAWRKKYLHKRRVGKHHKIKKKKHLKRGKH